MFASLACDLLSRRWAQTKYVTAFAGLSGKRSRYTAQTKKHFMQEMQYTAVVGYKYSALRLQNNTIYCHETVQ